MKAINESIVWNLNYLLIINYYTGYQSLLYHPKTVYNSGVRLNILQVKENYKYCDLVIKLGIWQYFSNLKVAHEKLTKKKKKNRNI